ncbi:hypothetical protein GMD78_06375 [Ornithinibacillus sp. L9]|uniref:Lipoprotein n=1 Tax=Ornithinibacillus caprae TaxID=2678566 RepID=A0A6N8FID9_9BACI|nr:DUF6612 family protein [Ornithinibacillus caprae]MUK88024.1 hypothetical protein [Ornithinibacillus caprae]
MKKWMISIAMVMLATGLVACGSESAEEVYTNAMEAAENMQSAEVIISMNQEMNLPSENATVLMESDMEGSIITDPVSMHQKGTMAMSMEGDGMENEIPMDVETEFYLVDNEIYMFESFSGQWMKADESMVPIDTLTSNQPDVSEQLEMMEEYVEELDFEESDDEFVFKLTANGEDFTELTKQMLDEYMPEDITAELGDITEVLEDMEIHNLDIEMYIDKESYDLTKYNIDMEMSMTIEGEEMNIIQKVDTVYKNINSIDSIEVPQEVLDAV